MITSPNRSSQAKSGDLFWKPVGLPICVNSPHPNIIVCYSSGQPRSESTVPGMVHVCRRQPLPQRASSLKKQMERNEAFLSLFYGAGIKYLRSPKMDLSPPCSSTRRNAIPLGVNCRQGFCTLCLRAVVPQTEKCLSLNRPSPGRVSQRHAPAVLRRLRRGERLRSPRSLPCRE